MIKSENLLKHKLLDLLSEPILDRYSKKDGSAFRGVSFSEIEKKIGVNRRKAWYIASELIENEEVIHCNVEFEGLQATDKGISSLSSGKYRVKFYSTIKREFQFWFNVVVTIMSLSIAIFTVIESRKSNTKLDEKIKDMSLREEKLKKCLSKELKHNKIHIKTIEQNLLDSIQNISLNN